MVRYTAILRAAPVLHSCRSTAIGKNLKKRIEYLMIAITAEEKKIIHAQYPDVHIVRTMKQDSKRHHYYMTEDKKPMKLLNKLRERGYNAVKGCVGNRSKKTRR